MIVKLLLYGSGIIMGLHGLVHLMGFAAYWPLAVVAELPYKTVLVGGRWNVGALGMRIFALLWLIAAIGFLAAAGGMLAHQLWWGRVLLATVVLSTLLIALDWAPAFRGAVVNLLILILVAASIASSSASAFQTGGLATPTAQIPTLPLPTNLPTPVARFYQTVYGDTVPVFTSAIVSSRGSMRQGGLKLPMRLRFTHEAGRGYRHYIEVVPLGLPLMKGEEWYLDGHARLNLPTGIVENDPKTDAGANLALWAETVVMPSVWLTDPRVRWEPIDETHARLVVPAPDGTDSFTATFSAATGLLERLESMRWKEPTSSAKTLWQNDLRDWRRIQGWLVPGTMSVRWGDQDAPWLEMTLDEIVYNADVTAYIRATGP